MTLSRHLLSGVRRACAGLRGARAPRSPPLRFPRPPKIESSPISPPSAAKPAPSPAPQAAAPRRRPRPRRPRSPRQPSPRRPRRRPRPPPRRPRRPAPVGLARRRAPGEALPAEPIPVEVAPKPKKSPKPAPPPLETALSTDPTPDAVAETFFATQKAAERYARIVEEGGWATDLPALRPGAQGRGGRQAAPSSRSSRAISKTGGARQRASGTPALTAAVKHFQSRMGLRQTGVVAGRDAEGDQRAGGGAPAGTGRQRGAALQRCISSSSSRYVVVNLPSTSVEAVQDGKVAHRYVAIVGDPDHPSPEISAHISVVNLNPTWTVPTSIIKKEIIPHMQRDPGYLSRMKIRVLDGQLHEIDPRTVDWSTERAANYILRQDSGAGNSLGSIRIGMPNKLAVYMHDTPGKALFGRDFRFLSHGCVRVQGVYDYAAWLLEDTPAADGAWDKAALLDKHEDQGAVRHQAVARRAGDLGLSDGLGERGRRRQFPQRRLRARPRRGGQRRGRGGPRAAGRGARRPRRAGNAGAFGAAVDLADLQLPQRALMRGLAPAAKPRRSLRRAMRDARARAPDGQPRRALPRRRADASAARRWTSKTWIACVCEFKGRRREVFGRGYTELFFRDEPTALAAGHRPCFECRRAEAVAFQAAFPGARPSAAEMDERLHRERLDPERLARRTPLAELAGRRDGAMARGAASARRRAAVALEFRRLRRAGARSGRERGGA